MDWNPYINSLDRLNTKKLLKDQDTEEFVSLKQRLFW